MYLDTQSATPATTASYNAVNPPPAAAVSPGKHKQVFFSFPVKTSGLMLCVIIDKAERNQDETGNQTQMKLAGNTGKGKLNSV